MADHLKQHYLEWTIVAAFLLAVVAWNYWPSWQESRIQSDLEFYATTIRQAPCDLSLKEQLLDRLDAIEDQMQRGKLLDHHRWRRHDAAIRGLLEQRLHYDTAHLIERELRRIQRQIEEKTPDAEANNGRR